jgi:hypothetical protein
MKTKHYGFKPEYLLLPKMMKLNVNEENVTQNIICAKMKQILNKDVMTSKCIKILPGKPAQNKVHLMCSTYCKNV